MLFQQGAESYLLSICSDKICVVISEQQAEDNYAKLARKSNLTLYFLFTYSLTRFIKKCNRGPKNISCIPVPEEAYVIPTH